MLRPLLKLMAFTFFTLTIIIFVLDSVHSVSASHWTTTPLNKMLANLLQTDISHLKQSIHNTIPTFLSSICITLICLPAWTVLGAFAVICCILNHEQKKHFHKILYTEEYI